jgi:hypothetical protein
MLHLPIAGDVENRAQKGLTSNFRPSKVETHLAGGDELPRPNRSMVANQPEELTRRSAIKQFAKIALFLLIVVFVTESMGSMAHSLSDFVAVSLLVAFVLTYFPIRATGKTVKRGRGNDALSARQRSQTSRSLIIVYLPLLTIASSALILTQEGILELLGLSIFLFGFDLILRRLHTPRGELPILLMTTVLYALLLMLLHYVPQTWYWLQKFSLSFSGLAGHVVGRDISLGITYLGLSIITLFAVCYVSMFILAKRRRPLALTAALSSLIVVNTVYVVGWTFLETAPLSPYLDFANPLFSGFDLRLLLFVLAAIPGFFLIRSAEIRAVPVPVDKTKLKYAAGMTAILVLSTATLVVQLPGTEASKDVVFYDSGYLDWSVPTFGQYGFDRIGMFGLLPTYLEAKGYTTEIQDTLTAESLGRVGTLVIINLNQSFDEQAKQAVWDFVENGGSLLVLGDHTGYKQIREPFNDLLQPVNIAYNFDSAIPSGTKWTYPDQSWSHPILQGISEDEMQIGIGASLTVSSPSTPIILSRYGFSDAGNPFDPQRGYLGDMVYAQGEQLGDLVLAAQSRYGKGKVLAFGDTTLLQNGALAHSYRFIDNIFSWLATDNGKSLYPYNVLLSLVLLVTSLVFLFVMVKVSTVSLAIYATVLALALAVLPTVPAITADDYGNLKADVASIDISHAERCDLSIHSSNGIDALSINLARNGYTPLLLRNFSPDRIRSSKLVAIVAPARSFSHSEIDAISEFVAQGGLLLLSVGWEEREASKPLLAEFGISVDNIPLGGITSAQDTGGVSLWEAWPVISKKAEGVDVLAEAWGYPVIIFEQFGEGGILIAGDSSFCLNKNLEEVYDYNEANILFLKSCLDKFRENWFQNG